jgi:DNA polymerase elongation subunit (family B)
LARDVLIKTKDIVQEHGFDLLYADTDAVFLRKDGALLEEYENITKILSKEIGIPISIEQYYKFLVLLPLEASERMEALKHYFGMTQSGEIIAKGIEIRRHDASNFIKISKQNYFTPSLIAIIQPKCCLKDMKAHFYLLHVRLTK